MDRSPRTSNKYNYKNLSAVRRALKDFLKLESRSQALGGYDSLATLIDLRDSIGLGPEAKRKPVLTDHQRRCITLCLVEDLTEVKAAEILGISQQAVYYSIQAGLVRIQRYLLTGEVRVIVFTKEEEARLIELYRQNKSTKEIAIELNKKLSTIRNKIKYLKGRGKLEVSVDAKK